MIRTITATEYVTPLREGGSLPAIIEGDDDGTYVIKFRGAGQGPKALIAELVSGEIARALGLPIPEIVLVNLEDDAQRQPPRIRPARIAETMWYPESMSQSREGLLENSEVVKLVEASKPSQHSHGFLFDAEDLAQFLPGRLQLRFVRLASLPKLGELGLDLVRRSVRL